MPKMRVHPTHNKIRMLEQLESCRLGMVADMLGLSVSDLLHLGRIERVAIFVFIATEHVASVHFPKITKAFSNDIDSYKGRHFTFGPETSMRHFRFDEHEDPNERLKVFLRGFWQLPSDVLIDIEHDFFSDLKNTCIRVSAEANSGEIVYAGIRDWDFTPAIDDLYIKNSDLRWLCNSFTNEVEHLIETKPSSEPMVQVEQPVSVEIKVNLEQTVLVEQTLLVEQQLSLEPMTKAEPVVNVDPVVKAEPVVKTEQTAEKIYRTTKNQCAAIVELLLALGFTENDLKGSIPELQKIFSARGLNKLATVDKNTITEWLTRGYIDRKR